MAGLKFVLSGVKFTDPNLPVLGADPILTNGSLVLVDMSKVDGSIPVSGSLLPNLAEDKAKVLAGGSSTVTLSYGVADTGVSKVNRTPKGGIYFANKPEVITNPFPANYLKIEVLGAIKDYIMANYKSLDKSKNHDFYFSLWMEIAYVGSSTFGVSQLANISNHNVAKVYYFERAAGLTAGRVKFSKKADQYGSSDPTNSNTVWHLFNAGKVGLNSYKIEERKPESTIFYRYYAEDLTVSGRTFDQVSAIDQALYDAAFAQGGKFSGDNYSNPAALF